MNVGVSVITTSETTMEEIGGNTVSYFDGKNEEELANIMLKTLTDQTYATKKVQEALKRAKLFRVQNMIEKLNEIYHLKN